MTTNVANITDASKNYLRHFIDYLETNDESSEEIEKTDLELKTLLIVTELAVGQALLWLKEAEKIDLLLHQNAANISEKVWIENDKANQQLFKMIIRFSKAALTACEQLQERGLAVEKHRELADCVAEFDRNMDWSIDDYVDSPAFQEFMEEAKEEYEAGEVEEGGWQL